MQYEKFMPIDPDFYDIIKDLITENQNLKIFYFDPELNVQESKGKFIEILNSKIGEFLVIENAKKVRLDRMITINGKPGPAYGEYDAFANACLSCQAGYDEK